MITVELRNKNGKVLRKLQAENANQIVIPRVDDTVVIENTPRLVKRINFSYLEVDNPTQHIHTTVEITVHGL